MAQHEEAFALVHEADMPSPVWKDKIMSMSTSLDGWDEAGCSGASLSPSSSDRLSFLHSNVRPRQCIDDYAKHAQSQVSCVLPMTITPQLKRIGQIACALVAEQCYQDGQCSDAPLQSPSNLDELELVMEHALLQCSALSQQHQTVATQLAHTKLQLATLQGS